MFEFLKSLPKSSRLRFEQESKRCPIVEDAERRVLQHCVSIRLLQFGRNWGTFVCRSVQPFAQREISCSLSNHSMNIKRRKDKKL